MIEPIYQGQTAIIAGTGPSVTKRVILDCNLARMQGKVKIFGVNLTYRDFDLDVMHACNYQIYDHYWPIDEKLRDGEFHKYTTRPELKGKYPGVKYIQEVWKDGFSENPEIVHAHHSTSPQLMNIALHYGIKRMLLVGFDMRYPGKISDREYSQPRHYFGDGEYAKELQHFPRTGAQGEMDGLIREFETINPEDYGIEIINCTPNSAMTCFPTGELEDYL